MNETTWELDLIRTQLRAAIERDLDGRTPRLRVTHRLRLRLAIPTLAVLAAATAAVVLGLTVSAASPSSASAAARRALAATAAAPSGTLATTVLHGGVTDTVDAARWNGSDIAFSPGFGPIPQILLIAGGMYVQTSDGTWLHYANASDIAPKPIGGLVGLAQDTIAGVGAQQILALATNVQKTAQQDGTTVYTGTIPSGNLDPALVPGNDAITSMILGAQKRTDMMFGAPKGNEHPGASCCQNDLQLQMNVGADGLVRQVSVTFQQQGTGSAAADGNYTWSVTYSQLGSTPPITAPATSTDVPPGTVPPGMLTPITRTQGSAQQRPSRLADELSFARCMRSHGLSRFPDPTAQSGVTLEMVRARGIDLHSPAVLRVMQACLPASHGALTPAKIRAAVNKGG
jgi:hypothetical protein